MARRRRDRAAPTAENVARREDVERLQSQIVQIRAEHFFSGPLPPPQMFLEYERACPGAGERILTMAEDQAHHRRTMETRNQVQGGRREQVGMVLGFVVAMTAIVGGIYLIANDKSAEGLTSIVTALAGLVGVFIYARKEKAKELSRKWDRMLKPGSN